MLFSQSSNQRNSILRYEANQAEKAFRSASKAPQLCFAEVIYIKFKIIPGELTKSTLTVEDSQLQSTKT